MKLDEVRSLEAFEGSVLTVSHEVPVIVDFSAAWCGPCKKLAPVLEKIYDEYSDRAYFVKVDIDELPKIAAQYNVSSVPTLLMFAFGEVSATIPTESARKVKASLEELL